MRAFLKNLISRFVKPQYSVGAGDDITKINYDEPNVQLDDKVHIGKLKKLLEEGDISSHAASKFMKGVRVFYESAVAYGLSHVPLDPIHLWNDAKVRDKESDHGTVEYHRMEDAVTGQPAYSLLAKVAKYGGMIA